MDPVTDWLSSDTTLTGLPLAFLLGALVGAEREWRQNAAGLRSCVLVSVAAAGFADLMTTRVEPGNLGAAFGAIATGVGFIGAGVILRRGMTVRGLSTAATFWAVAAVGTASGVEEFGMALGLTVLVFSAHVALRPISALIERKAPPAEAGPR